MVIDWVLDGLSSLHFEEDAFLNVILRNFEDLKEEEQISEEPLEEPDEGEFELMFENDYDFEVLE